MNDLQDSISQYQDAAVELRKLLAEAHQAIRDLRQERKDLRRQREEFVNGEDIVRKLDRSVADGIKAYEDGMITAIRDATEKVYERFDTIMLVCLGEDPESVRKGKKSVTDLIREVIRAREMPIKITEEIHIEMSPKTKADQKSTNIDVLMKAFRSRGLDELPIILDSRVPDDTIWLVIPPVDDNDRRMIYEVNWRDGSGAVNCAEALLDYRRRSYQAEKKRLDAIPAAFKRKTGAGPARSGPNLRNPKP